MNWVEAGPGRLIAVTIAVLAAAVSIGAIAALTGHDDTAHPGDIAVTIRDFAFHPPALEMPAGEVGLIAHNADAALHDFTIDDIVSLDVPGTRIRRVSFTLPPGAYTYWCTLHPTMTGRLDAT
ncbi:cupredoxin domain-containing protein [Egicoccus sp. AB-alg6-2]|uniref:cupredoxin domain-containing protein n=1 Tax=Egicoccus sp. AB-alg6-2 TaxID=3242692 RepID=UPI00359D8629